MQAYGRDERKVWWMQCSAKQSSHGLTACSIARRERKERNEFAPTSLCHVISCHVIACCAVQSSRVQCDMLLEHSIQ